MHVSGFSARVRRRRRSKFRGVRLRWCRRDARTFFLRSSRSVTKYGFSNHSAISCAVSSSCVTPAAAAALSASADSPELSPGRGARAPPPLGASAPPVPAALLPSAAVPPPDASAGAGGKSSAERTAMSASSTPISFRFSRSISAPIEVRSGSSVIASSMSVSSSRPSPSRASSAVRAASMVAADAEVGPLPRHMVFFCFFFVRPDRAAPRHDARAARRRALARARGACRYARAGAGSTPAALAVRALGAAAAQRGGRSSWRSQRWSAAATASLAIVPAAQLGPAGGEWPGPARYGRCGLAAAGTRRVAASAAGAHHGASIGAAELGRPAHRRAAAYPGGGGARGSDGGARRGERARHRRCGHTRTAPRRG